MAFIGLLAVTIGLIIAVLVISIAPIIIGTIVYKTGRKKLGLALKIFGYFMLIPVFAAGIVIVTANFLK